MPAKRNTELDVVVIQALEDKVKNDAGELSPCTAVTMCSLDALEMPKEEVFTLQLAGHQTPTQVSETFWHRAYTHSSGSEDKVQYRISFFYGDAVERRPYKFFVVSARAFGEAGVAEGTAKGLVKSVMSAFNYTLAQTFAQQQSLNDTQNRMIERLSANLEKALDKKDAATEQFDIAIRVMQMMKAAEDDKTHEHRLAEIEKMRNAELWSAGIQFLPALLRSVTGKALLGEEAGDTAILKAMFAAIEKSGDKELPMRVLSALNAYKPEVAGVVADRAVEIKKQEEERLDKRNQALQAIDGIPLPPELKSIEGGKAKGQ